MSDVTAVWQESRETYRRDFSEGAEKIQDLLKQSSYGGPGENSSESKGLTAACASARESERSRGATRNGKSKEEHAYKRHSESSIASRYTQFENDSLDCFRIDAPCTEDLEPLLTRIHSALRKGGKLTIGPGIQDPLHKIEEQIVRTGFINIVVDKSVSAISALKKNQSQSKVVTPIPLPSRYRQEGGSNPSKAGTTLWDLDAIVTPLCVKYSSTNTRRREGDDPDLVNRTTKRMKSCDTCTCGRRELEEKVERTN